MLQQKCYHYIFIDTLQCKLSSIWFRHVNLHPLCIRHLNGIGQSGKNWLMGMTSNSESLSLEIDGFHSRTLLVYFL